MWHISGIVVARADVRAHRAADTNRTFYFRSDRMSALIANVTAHLDPGSLEYSTCSVQSTEESSGATVYFTRLQGAYGTVRYIGTVPL